MITIDLISWLMYSQLLMSVVFFFFVQVFVMLARRKLEAIFDWFIYRGTWIASGFQVIFTIIFTIVAFYTETNPERVGWTGVLLMTNTAWLVSLRLVFLIADHIYRQEHS